jgi:hypothetical protein
MAFDLNAFLSSPSYGMGMQALNNIGALRNNQPQLYQDPHAVYRQMVNQRAILAQRDREQQAMEDYREKTLAQRQAESSATDDYRTETLAQRREEAAATADYRAGTLGQRQAELDAQEERLRQQRITDAYTYEAEGWATDELGNRYNPRLGMARQILELQGLTPPQTTAPAPMAGDDTGAPPPAAGMSTPAAGVSTPAPARTTPSLPAAEMAREVALRQQAAEQDPNLTDPEDRFQSIRSDDILLNAMIDDDEAGYGLNVGGPENWLVQGAQTLGQTVLGTPVSQSYRNTQAFEEFTKMDVASQAKSLGTNPTDFDIEFLQSILPTSTDTEERIADYFYTMKSYQWAKQRIAREQMAAIQQGQNLINTDWNQRVADYTRQYQRRQNELKTLVRAAVDSGQNPQAVMRLFEAGLFDED